MKYLFAVILDVDAVLGFYFAFSFLWSNERRYKENRALALFSLFSGLWSLGFGMLFLQESQTGAYLWRNIGICGTVGSMITIQMLVCYVAKLSRKWVENLFIGISLLGIPVWILAVQPDQCSFIMTKFGMSYKFTPGLVNNIYTTYFLVVAFNILLVILNMIFRSDLKRVKYFGRRFLAVEILVLIGTVLDMVFPALGFPALPGSNVTQFWGLIVLFVAIRVIDNSRLNIKNMSGYIYYSLNNPVLVYDPDKVVHVVNDAAAEFFQIDRECIGKGDFDKELFELESLFDFDGKEYICEGDHAEVDVVCRNNHIPCNISVNRIKDDYGDLIGYIVIITDLSDRVKALEEVENARHEADRANRAKSAFLANMSHEIRTPMNAIMGFSELVLNEQISDTAKNYVTDIKASSQSLLSIINAILDISKIESGKMELIYQDFWTSKLINEATAAVRLQIKEKGLDFELYIDPKIPAKINGDETKLKEILINLLNNAYKYTEKGSVKLSISVLSISSGVVQLEYKISDSGIGIKEEDLKYLYENFTRVDTKRNTGVEGTGLGLSIVKSYVDMMGGVILVSSIYGKGSTFTVKLSHEIIDSSPIMMEKVKTESEEAQEIVNYDGARVLVVDDNRVNIRVISSVMKKYGLSVDTAGGGYQALELLKENEYPIIFLDQMMPEIDGVETMHAIRDTYDYYKADGPGKIVVLTANAIVGVKEELIAEGFDDYLEKPMNFKELERVLGTYLY